MHRPILTAILATVACLAPLAAAARPTTPIHFARPSAGIVLEFDTSARGAGMGGDAVAAFWGDGPDAWANPALLGFQRGVRLNRFSSQLVPDFSDDVKIRSESLCFGAYGLGVLLARGPASGTRLRVGEIQLADDGGVILEDVSLGMRYREQGVGLSLGEAARSLLGDRLPPATRRFDLALGWTVREYDSVTVPDSLAPFPPPLARESAVVHDLGLLLKATPLELAAPGLGGLRLDVAYGLSTLNGGDKAIRSGEMLRPLPKLHLRGWGARVATGVPPFVREACASIGAEWLADSFDPLVSFGLVGQKGNPGYDWTDDGRLIWTKDDDRESKSSGWELGLANILFLRGGHVESWGEIDGDTDGWGLGFRLGRVLGCRYDKATVPQATGLSDVERESFSFFLDLLALRAMAGD